MQDAVDNRKPPPRLALRTAYLWTGVAAAPGAWFAHIFASYGVATIVCDPAQVFALHLTMAICLAIGSLSLVIGVHVRRVLAQTIPEDSDPVRIRRAGFLAYFSLFNGVIFLLAILAQSYPNFFLDPCAYMG